MASHSYISALCSTTNKDKQLHVNKAAVLPSKESNAVASAIRFIAIAKYFLNMPKACHHCRKIYMCDTIS